MAPPKTTNQHNERAIKKGQRPACKPRLSAGERSSASCRLAQSHHGFGHTLESLAGTPRRAENLVERSALGEGERPPQQRGPQSALAVGDNSAGPLGEQVGKSADLLDRRARAREGEVEEDQAGGFGRLLEIGGTRLAEQSFAVGAVVDHGDVA